ncbi:MAG: 4-hydroxy-3-methylbut-2-enyl diphosphate reductase, partial [Candidatus Marinimicrobia bacterium]|nr:4-hydroxy-3-methylbut-2-enyl diphosphate reductase [Candidatus Neomarinimicrobiota bacterium]
VWEAARYRGFTIIDATCPLVLNIHKAAQTLEADGRTVIIIGDKDHDEVTAIASELTNSIIVSDSRDVESLPKIRKAGVVVQSTRDIAEVNKIMSKIVEKVEDLRFINTICKPTRDRQRQVIELASLNDVVLIIGSRTSANTKRLATIASAINPKTFLIQNADELNPNWFEKAQTIGISTGASTPVESIKEVEKKIARFSS